MNLGGYKWLPVDGYGRFCLKTGQALIRAGHEVYPFDIDSLDKPAWYLAAQGLDFSHVTVQLMPPNMMRNLPGRSVAYTMHESMTLPPGWADSVNDNNELLVVPSPWLVNVFKEDGVKLPIEVVKSGIDPEECPITRQNHSRPFTFGALGDRGGRKGDKLVWAAFYKAFDYKNRDVRLVIKCRPGSLGNLDLSYSRDSRLALWRADVENISDIYARMDAFMFPTHCEGWGQPPREAAACGVPTVVTRWSGTDDETDKWAIPLDSFKMVESSMLGSGGKWARPDLDEIVHWMRWLYEHQDEAKAQALKAAQWLRENRTYAQAADNLVATMNKHLGGPPPVTPPPMTDADRKAAVEQNRQSLAALEANSNGHRKVEATG